MRKLSIFKKLIVLLNVVFALLLLFAVIASYLRVSIFVSLHILSLFVPLLFFANVLFCVYWILRRDKRFFISFLLLSIGYFAFGVFYKIVERQVKDDSSTFLKVVSYNSQGFNVHEHIKESDVGEKIIAFINDENPDIICFQEANYSYLKEFDKYPHQYWVSKSGSGKSKTAIISKYPIIKNASMGFPNTRNASGYTDIVYKKDTIRIYNLHLESYSIVPSTKTFSEKESERNYKKMVRTFEKQLEQANIFKAHRDASPYRTLVCGDFNNTQFSNVYRIVKGDFQDSFIEAGKSFGRTYDLKGFPMRIDYIMADESFEVLEHQNYDIKLSDHYPIKATLRLKD